MDDDWFLREMESKLFPDLEWYTTKSISVGKSPRCPFASIKRCPRFYQSVALMGESGSTNIPEKANKKLLKAWKKSQLWPITNEQATSISGPAERIKHYWNFCPEVTFERFGIFTTDIDEYADEVDMDFAHSKLAALGISTDDWRWRWLNVRPQHYFDCPLFSVLQELTSAHRGEDIIDIKPNFYGIGINVNALLRKIQSYLRMK